MRIVHSGDLHFGYRQYGLLERELDFYNAAENMVSRIIDLKADALILAGDIFDTPKPPALAVRQLCELVKRLRSANISVFGIDGNHDYAMGDWLRVTGIQQLSAVPIVDEKTGISIAGVSALRPTMFHKAVDMMVNAGKHVDIFVMHQAIGELANFDVQDITAFELAPKLAKLGVRYVAMGDIHDYKDITVGGVRFCYSGSIEVNAIDEEHNKCFVVIDIDRDDIKLTLEPIQTRHIMEIYLENEKDVDELLAELSDKKPLAYIRYAPDHKELAERAAAVLAGKHILYRITPVEQKGVVAALNNDSGYERKSAINRLKGAVSRYFDENTEQYQLVFRLLDRPDDTDGVIAEYFKSKGLEIKIGA